MTIPKKQDSTVHFDLPSINIPTEVLFNPFLTNSEQKLFGFIRNLSQSSSGCCATNKYLGRYLFLKQRTVSAGVAKLKEYKYIKTNEEELADGRTIRRIFINPDFKNLYKPLVMKINDDRNEGKCPDEKILKDLIQETVFKGISQELTGVCHE